jgi:hypothetical protein
MSTSVYWIHHPEHTDMFSQGYIGVSSNVRARWNRHKREAQNPHLGNAIKKYGWDTLVKRVLLIADEAYCLMIEAKLRAQDTIGWNIIKGGGKPPPAYGNKTRLGLPPSNKGTGIIRKQMALFRTAWNKNLTTADEVKAKQSAAKIGKPSPRKGAVLSEETIAKIKANRPKTVLSEAGRQAISNASLGRKHDTVICPHCGKVGGMTAMPRWHFNNCKES